MKFAYTYGKNRFSDDVIMIIYSGVEVGEISEREYEAWHKELNDEEFYCVPYQYFAKRTAPGLGRFGSIAAAKKAFQEFANECTEELEAFVSKGRGDCKAKYLPKDPDVQFYPTPEKLAGRLFEMLNKKDFHRINCVLEPSAGKGDLLSAFRKFCDNKTSKSNLSIDVIEFDENLAAILRGNEEKVVFNDFLNFSTPKQYDLIIMNPPFQNADKHILKAISLIERNGGIVLAICNAETLKTPYTNTRKLLRQKLSEYSATVKFVQSPFAQAERKTAVDVALIRVSVPDKSVDDSFFENLKQRFFKEKEIEVKDIVSGNRLEALIANYNLEVFAGIELINHYRALAPRIMSDMKHKNYDCEMLILRLGRKDENATVNGYVESVRAKYWRHLFYNETQLLPNLTSSLRDKYTKSIAELSNYDFSLYNIKQVIAKIGMELCENRNEQILRLFDMLTTAYSYYPECQNNIHYFNGWCTNKAHKIGKKVIIPLNGAFAESWSRDYLSTYTVYGTLGDIEKTLSYLDVEGIANNDKSDIEQVILNANACCISKNIEARYFKFTLYKKGPCHIVFNSEFEKLIERFNIFAAQQRNWLPPSYGRKKYTEMNKEERAVIDSFQGEKAYNEVMDNKEYYLSDLSSIPLLPSC